MREGADPRTPTVAGMSVINICFHGIGTPRRELEPGEADYWISTDSFHRIIDVIAERPEVRISFDDGNASDVEHGLPALTERGLTASFFVLAGRLGSRGSLDADAVRQLATEGMRIGSHGMDHRSWRGLDSASAHRELVEARDAIAAAAGRDVDEAALPRGQYDRSTMTHLRRLDYTHVHTSDRAWAVPTAWLQPRFSVRRHDTVETVRRQMLQRPSALQRAERALVCTAKRLR